MLEKEKNNNLQLKLKELNEDKKNTKQRLNNDNIITEKNKKQRNRLIKKRNKTFNDKKIGNYAYNEQLEKEAIERRNEYKEDIRNLILEDNEKQRLINSKEFSNYLNNKVFYNDPAVNINKTISKEDKINQINNLNYLKKLAFEDNAMKTSNGSQESGNNNIDSQKSCKKIFKKNIDWLISSIEDILKIVKINLSNEKKIEKLNIDLKDNL